MQKIYRDFDQAGLDAQYNNRARFANFTQHFAAWGDWSRAARAELPGNIDIAFGPSAVEKLDLFAGPDADAPLYVFIHGGYWYSLDKSDYSYVAQGMRPHGYATAVINYGLAPAYDMDEIVRQNRAALAFLWRHAAELAFDRGRIYVAGHSAGGHLAAMLMATDWPQFAGDLPTDLVKGVCAIGGIFDLEPIRLSYLNDKVRLTEPQVERHSPLRCQYRCPAPLLLAVAADESDEFHRQSLEMAVFWRSLGASVDMTVPAGLDHFDVVNQLRDPACGLIDLQLKHIDRCFPAGR
jgi:arylformamidase